MAEQICGLSSMATKGLLGRLSEAVRRDRSLAVHFESAGGLQVVRDIRAGVRADLAVLSSEQMSSLGVEGLFEVGTLRPLFVSDVVGAVPSAAATGPLVTEADLTAALTGARRIAYSTGPSGTALLALIERWGLTRLLEQRLVQAPPGTPVASLLAGGVADLGFQQRSELAGASGIRLLGPLPGAAAIRTTFSGAVLARSTNAQSAGEVLRFLGSKTAEEHVSAAGMIMA